MDQPEDKWEENRRFFDRWALNYDRFLFGRWMRSVQRKAVQLRPLPEKSTALDLGCGTGYLLYLLSKKITKGKIVGIDFSPIMLRQARRKLQGIKHVHLRQAYVEHLPYPAGTFEYIFSTEAFHHFPQPEQALQEMARVVQKGGTILIVDLYLPPLVLGNFLFKLEPGFIRMYSKADFRRMAQKAGLQLQQQKRINFFALAHLLRKP